MGSRRAVPCHWPFSAIWNSMDWMRSGATVAPSLATALTTLSPPCVTIWKTMAIAMGRRPTTARDGTLCQMMDCEMVTFKAGIQWGCQLIMTAHIGAPNVTGSDVPSTMSPIILQDKLREELGYQNIIITDGMEMGAITQQYTSAEAAVGSIQAGVDIVLGPKNLVDAFDAVIDAVNNGTISEERINQSVRRILKLKMK